MEKLKSLFSSKKSKPSKNRSQIISQGSISSQVFQRQPTSQLPKPEIKNLSKTDKTPRIIIVLDETGSMCGSKSVTISSYNEWLDSNRSKEEEEENFPRFTLVRFNTDSELEEHESVKTAPRLSDSNYNPRNCTALYDAIGKSINSYKDEKDNIMVILTDGDENSSRFFDRVEVKSLLEDYTENHGWIFHYLGASTDSWSVGQTIGISDKRFCTSYVADGDGFDHAWAEQAVQMKAYRGYQAKKSRGLSVEKLNDMDVPRIDKESYISDRNASKF